MVECRVNTEAKSLELARLMGWKITITWIFKTPYLANNALNPYGYDRDGLAQFAAILLKFPEVILACDITGKDNWFHLDALDSEKNWMPPTQANILDEILRMNGVLI